MGIVCKLCRGLQYEESREFHLDLLSFLGRGPKRQSATELE